MKKLLGYISISLKWICVHAGRSVVVTGQSNQDQIHYVYQNFKANLASNKLSEIRIFLLLIFLQDDYYRTQCLKLLPLLLPKWLSPQENKTQRDNLLTISMHIEMIWRVTDVLWTLIPRSYCDSSRNRSSRIEQTTRRFNGRIRWMGYTITRRRTANRRVEWKYANRLVFLLPLPLQVRARASDALYLHFITL